MTSQTMSRVYFIGNPSAGKSTMIQALTGRDSLLPPDHYQQDGRAIWLEELPGIYSLGSTKSEEIDVRRQLVARRPDLLVNVVDATNLERDLYLTVQLVELGLPLIVALSKQDKARSAGFRIEAERLSARLNGVPVISAEQNGAGELPLRQAIEAVLAQGLAAR
ncbi:MAG: 50S ribosome-binding GTPase [Caldilineales bacterium]|nr:50S ribosome-binding GTPase [Caldilineales bacterium]